MILPNLMLMGNSGGFTPAKLSPLFWYRGDLGITSDVNGVSAWADQSTHGNTLIQTTNINKPAYVANSGKGYIDTTSLNGLRSLGCATGPTQAQAFELMLVLQPASATPAGYGYAIDSSSGNVTAVFQVGVTGLAGTYMGTAVISDVQLTVADHIVDLQANGASTNIAVDGDAGTVGNAGAGGLAAPLVIGNSPLNFTSGFRGRIYEVLGFAGALSAPNRALMIAYLKGRYGIA